MKKIINILLAICIAISLFGCGSESKLQGKWTDDNGDSLEFRKDGTVRITINVLGFSQTNEYRYKADDSSITLYESGDVGTVIYYIIENNELTINGSLLLDGTYYKDYKPSDNQGTNNSQETDGKAYAVLTDSGDFILFRSTNSYSSRVYTKVTDIHGKQYTGTVFTNVENDGFPDWLPEEGSDTAPGSNNYYVRRVYVAENTVIHPVTMMWWFAGFTDLKSFNGRGIDTSNVYNMDSTFAYCSSLTEIDLSGFVTDKVDNMHMMFYGCSSLQSLNLSNFNTEKVKNMSVMFYGCKSLVNLDLSSFNTRNVEHRLMYLSTTGMEYMFEGCDSLREVKLGKGFTNWIDEAYLPDGTWTNGNTKKTERELYQQYPSHSSSWAGSWHLTDKSNNSYLDRAEIDLIANDIMEEFIRDYESNYNEKIVAYLPDCLWCEELSNHQYECTYVFFAGQRNSYEASSKALQFTINAIPNKDYIIENKGTINCWIGLDNVNDREMNVRNYPDTTGEIVGSVDVDASIQIYKMNYEAYINGSPYIWYSMNEEGSIWVADGIGTTKEYYKFSGYDYSTKDMIFSFN